MKLVLIGIQGSGKSTQGNLLSRQLGIPYLSTGHIFREIAKEKTHIGRYIKETINGGSLIPDDQTEKIVHEYLNRPEYKNGYILDGFPRTVHQVEVFKNHIDKAIYIEVPDQDALWRIAHRDESSRGDETLPSIKRRIDLFHKLTHPVIEYYEKKEKLVLVDGTQDIEAVNEAILNGLGKELVENHVREWKQKQDIIIALVGLPGSGKSVATDYFKSKEIPTVHFSQVTDEVNKRGLAHTEVVTQAVRSELREKHGMEALAKLNVGAIKKALADKKVVILENMHSFEEYEYLKDAFPKIKIVIIGLFANKEMRYTRVKSRQDRNKLFGEERDINELIHTNSGPTFGFADYIVINEGTKQDFHNKLENIYREIYFA